MPLIILIDFDPSLRAPTIWPIAMILAYHAIFTTFGAWLPNDPRGSYSKHIYNEELRSLGEIRYGRQSPQPPRSVVSRFRVAAIPKLSRPPFYLNDKVRLDVAASFEVVATRLSVNVLACAILNNHVHLVILRGRHRVEYLVNQFKGAATKRLSLTETPWGRKCWKVFLNDGDAVDGCCHYVDANPEAAGLAAQNWAFVSRRVDIAE